MKNDLLERRPVKYSAAAIRVLHFERPAHHSGFHLHWHDRMELLRVRQGKLRLTNGTEQFVLSPGEVAIIAPKALHQGIPAGEAVVYDTVMFDVRSFYNETEVCKTLLPAIFDGRIVFQPITDDPVILEAFDVLYAARTDGSLGTLAAVYRMLDLFYERVLLEERKAPKNAMVRKITAYMEAHFAEELTTADLCREFGYTAAHLCRKFKEAIGLSPMTYLKIYRLEQACKKLNGREGTISEIAMSCGFSDANYFTRCFKAHYRVAPSRYEG